MDVIAAMLLAGWLTSAGVGWWLSGPRLAKLAGVFLALTALFLALLWVVLLPAPLSADMIPASIGLTLPVLIGWFGRSTVRGIRS